MIAGKRIGAIVAVAAALGAGSAQARGGLDVHWQVNIGLPVPVVVVPAPRVYAPPLPPVVVHPYPVYGGGPRWAPAPVYHPGYRQPTHWDVDGDGIPNRRDPVYNPRWDRDGDGRPDRYERHRYDDRYDRHDRFRR
jgi:hypothetical protein